MRDYFNFHVPFDKAMGIWGGYTSVLGFLLVFRTQIAYSRFWEGGTTLQQVRGVWFNAVSNLVAFSNDSEEEEMRFKVEKFQHLLVRLMSMMYCSALQQIADMDDEHFEIIDVYGVNVDSLKYLSASEDRCEVIMQWIQRLIVINTNQQVVCIAPPILSRVFQELSNGIVDVQNARKISEFKFPFPYAQMLTVSLIVHWICTPFVSAMIIEPGQRVLGAFIVGVSVWGLWSINYIAAEIENPFGDDPNDLPVENMQTHFNRSLRTLIDPLCQIPPSFEFDRAYHKNLYGMPNRVTEMFGEDSDEESGPAEAEESDGCCGCMGGGGGPTDEAKKAKAEAKEARRHWSERETQIHNSKYSTDSTTPGDPNAPRHLVVPFKEVPRETTAETGNTRENTTEVQVVEAEAQKQQQAEIAEEHTAATVTLEECKTMPLNDEEKMEYDSPSSQKPRPGSDLSLSNGGMPLVLPPSVRELSWSSSNDAGAAGIPYKSAPASTWPQPVNASAMPNPGMGLACPKVSQTPRQPAHTAPSAAWRPADPGGSHQGPVLLEQNHSGNGDAPFAHEQELKSLLDTGSNGTTPHLNGNGTSPPKEAPLHYLQNGSGDEKSSTRRPEPVAGDNSDVFSAPSPPPIASSAEANGKRPSNKKRSKDESKPVSAADAKPTASDGGSKKETTAVL
eukprot:TRINITY_DN30906_c0_g1_i1.p1 TRINITY_DN30906_c0_g1~~TRINITY_DN30906_c0_g1_i1.p1  ORF type:complete len:675 (+),score=136.83 TRINITY_DN30906_c0_g1_i1:168-2192(+)